MSIGSLKRTAAAILGAAALLVAVLLVRTDSPRTPDRDGGATHRGSVASGISALEGRTGERSASQPILPLPPSLIGTSEDGALIVDADGRFVATPDAIDLFDYYLSATGEESELQIHARIGSVIRARLDGEAAVDALRLLDDYFAYRRRAASQFSGQLFGEDLERRLQYIRELRREVFGESVARALFGEEEARWFVDLERRRVIQDPSLEPAEREAQLEALEAEWPEEVLALRDSARSHRLLRDEEAFLQADGADSNEIARLREERFGVEPARRLAALDATRRQWQDRLGSYRAGRDRLLEEAPLAERDLLIDGLRSRLFSESEIGRVHALDRIEAQTSAEPHP